MIHRLVITINMSNNIMEHFKNVPYAVTGMVSRIISEIDSDKSIKLVRYQVLIVLGKMNTQKMVNTAIMLENWSTSWNYSYITSDKDVHVTKVMDKAVCTIIKIAIREMLWKFYRWDSLNSNFYN